MPTMHMASRPGVRILTASSRGADDAPPWQQQGLCRPRPDLFFPENGKRSGQETAMAKAICSWCRVREGCLQWAVDNDIRYGIWGGKTELQRAAARPKTAKPTVRERAMSNLAAGEKQCSRCQVVRPLDSFGKSASSIDGRRGVCKACRADQDAAIQQRRSQLRNARRAGKAAA